MDVAPSVVERVVAEASPPPSTLDAPQPSSLADLDWAAAALADRAVAFARTPPLEKAALLRAAIPAIRGVAAEMASRSCRAAGVDPNGPLAGAAWLSGPVALLAAVRRYAEALEDIAKKGRPFMPARHLRGRLDGRVVARLAPRSIAERAFQGGAEAAALLAEGVTPEDVIAGQAGFYRQADPAGGVALVVGDGFASAAAPLRALDALFVEGKVALVEIATAGAPLVPLFQRALLPLIEAGFLRVVSGGDTPGAHLAAKLGAPLRAASGGGGPVIVVPAFYARDELWFIARRLVSAIAAGRAFGTSAPREIVVGGCWAQRGLFVEHVERALALCPFALPVSTREDVPAGAGAVGLVAAACDEPVAMLAAAVDRCNVGPDADAAEIVIHVVQGEDPEILAALHGAVARIRCRTLGINQWPALVGFRGDAPEGPPMLSRVDKTLVRGPLRSARRPAYFLDEPRGAQRGSKLCAFQAAPSLGALLRGARG
jgi:hypothetical protein